MQIIDFIDEKTTLGGLRLRAQRFSNTLTDNEFIPETTYNLNHLSVVFSPTIDRRGSPRNAIYRALGWGQEWGQA